MYKNYEIISSIPSLKQETQNKSSVFESGLIREIINKNSDLKDEILVIKLPAEIIEDDALLANFVDNIKVIADSGAGIILVHDYTNLVSSTLSLFNINQKKISEFQGSDHKTTQIIEMVLSGYVNKKIVSFLCSNNCKAIGISGKDGYLIESRRSFVAQKSCDDIIDFGFIGEPISVNAEILLNFLDNNIITVVSPVSFGLNKVTHILDADLTAAMIAGELSARHLIFLTSLGKLSVSGEGLKICTLSKLHKLHQQNAINQEYDKIIQASKKALENNTKYIHISPSKAYDSTLLTIFTDSHSTKVIL